MPCNCRSWRCQINTEGLYVGLMCGTSVDAIDALAARWTNGVPEIVGTFEHPVPDPLRQTLIAAMGDRQFTFAELSVLNAQVTTAHAEAVRALMDTHHLDPAHIAAVGFHGQTVFHAPDADPPFTVQLGNPSQLAAATGLCVVADVRRADMALGGQGAPLAPGLHHALFKHSTESRAILNLGGIANLTLLPTDNSPVRGFDTGPANALIDAWCASYLGLPRDENGDRAALGEVNQNLLGRLLGCTYFQRNPPKSTGREVFSLDWVEAAVGSARLRHEDVLATLTELTAVSVSDALEAHCLACDRVLVAGGGRHNRHLMARLRHLIPCCVDTTDDHGVDGDSLEALLMAWIARQRLFNAPANLPSVTGARATTPLGGLFLPPTAH